MLKTTVTCAVRKVMGNRLGKQADLGGENLSKQTVSGVSWQMLASAIKFVAQFGTGIALARLLPPEDFGIVGLAYIATGFATILTDLGLGPALIQRRDISERHIRLCHTFSLSSALVIGAALYVSAGFIADFFNDARVEPVLQVLAFTFPFSGFSITSGAILTRRMAFNTIVKIELFASVVGYGGVAIALAVSGFGYWSLVGGTLVQTVLATLLTYAVTRHDLRPFLAREELRDLFGFSAGMSLTSTANYFARQGDYFVVGRLMDATSLGFYSRAYSLMQLPLTFFGRALSRVLFPAASKVQDDPARFQRAFRTTFSLSVAVSLPVSLAIAILAPEIILVLYGEKWLETAPLLAILAPFGVFRMSYNTAVSFVRAYGQAYRLFLSQVIYGVLVIGGSWWAGSIWGLEGVAWAVGGAITVMWLMVTGFASRAASLTPSEMGIVLLQSVAPGLVTGSVVLGLTYGLRALDLPHFVVLMIAFPAFGVTTLGGVLLLTKRLKHAALDAIVTQLTSSMSGVWQRIGFGTVKNSTKYS